MSSERNYLPGLRAFEVACTFQHIAYTGIDQQSPFPSEKLWSSFDAVEAGGCFCIEADAQSCADLLDYNQFLLRFANCNIEKI